jgi:photoactive yellow protein
MSDNASNQDPDDRSILDAGSADEPSEETGTSDPAPADAADPADAGEAAPPEADDLHFESDTLGVQLRRASEDTLDRAPFGIIKVDDEGTVEFFNQYESDLSGMDPEDVEGRNFFTQVAPCTNNRLFRGRFKKGVRRGELDETFTYTYTYKMRPTLVDVHMFRDEEGNNWITVQKY